MLRQARANLQLAPTLLASSVVRGAQLKESHGGLCIVDFATGRTAYALEWNSTLIDVDGRGGDRGLRGVAIAGEHVYALASDALLVFDRRLQLLRAFTNHYLRHCHELSIHDGIAGIVSTGYDAILFFDLDQQQFVRGLHLRADKGRIRVLRFDPRSQTGPGPCNDFHLNSIRCDGTGIYFAGLRTGALWRVRDNQLARVAVLPEGTHNAQPFRDGIIYNDTARDRLCVRYAGREIAIPVPVDEQAAATWVHAADARLARPLFARGLCLLPGNYVAAGSSPSTITLYDIEDGESVAQMSLSTDVRNAIHGLSLWPQDPV